MNKVTKFFTRIIESWKEEDDVIKMFTIGAIFSFIIYIIIAINELLKQLTFWEARFLPTSSKKSKNMESKILKENKNFYIDSNGNKFSKINYTEWEATKASKSLINCKNCEDCQFCEDCINCIGCENCKNCINCENCLFCKNCSDCKKSKYCIN